MSTSNELPDIPRPERDGDDRDDDEIVSKRPQRQPVETRRNDAWKHSNFYFGIRDSSTPPGNQRLQAIAHNVAIPFLRGEILLQMPEKQNYLIARNVAKIWKQGGGGFSIYNETTRECKPLDCDDAIIRELEEYVKEWNEQWIEKTPAHDMTSLVAKRDSTSAETTTPPRATFASVDSPTTSTHTYLDRKMDLPTITPSEIDYVIDENSNKHCGNRDVELWALNERLTILQREHPRDPNEDFNLAKDVVSMCIRERRRILKMLKEGLYVPVTNVHSAISIFHHIITDIWKPKWATRIFFFDRDLDCSPGNQCLQQIAKEVALPILRGQILVKDENRFIAEKVADEWINQDGLFLCRADQSGQYLPMDNLFDITSFLRDQISFEWKLSWKRELEIGEEADTLALTTARTKPPPSKLFITKSSSMSVSPLDKDCCLGKRGVNFPGTRNLKQLTRQIVTASDLRSSNINKAFSRKVVGAWNDQGGRFFEFSSEEHCWIQLQDEEDIVDRLRIAITAWRTKWKKTENGIARRKFKLGPSQNGSAGSSDDTSVDTNLRKAIQVDAIEPTDDKTRATSLLCIDAPLSTFSEATKGRSHGATGENGMNKPFQSELSSSADQIECATNVTSQANQANEATQIIPYATSYCFGRKGYSGNKALRHLARIMVTPRVLNQSSEDEGFVQELITEWTHRGGRFLKCEKGYWNATLSEESIRKRILNVFVHHWKPLFLKEQAEHS